MKVVVTSQGNEMTSEVDPRFGRANYFIVVDTNSGEHRVVDNTENLNASQGAGVQAAQTVAGLKADAVITGHCGPRAFGILSSAGVKVYVGVEGTVEEAMTKFQGGNCVEADGPSVEGHW
jgi:predicted Fe-Mo cluster-binding NifX family protein